MGVFAGWLASNGLSILSKAIKIGVGYGVGGKKQALEEAADALGVGPDADEKALLEAAKQPGGLAKLREIEQRIPIAQIQADSQALADELDALTQALGLDVQDRTNARYMYTTTRDPTPRHLTYFVCSVWLVMAFLLFFREVTPGNRELVIRMMATLEGSIATTIAFWLGSSDGSKAKTDIMSIGARRAGGALAWVYGLTTLVSVYS